MVTRCPENVYQDVSEFKDPLSITAHSTLPLLENSLNILKNFKKLVKIPPGHPPSSKVHDMNKNNGKGFQKVNFSLKVLFSISCEAFVICKHDKKQREKTSSKINNFWFLLSVRGQLEKFLFSCPQKQQIINQKITHERRNGKFFGAIFGICVNPFAAARPISKISF